MSDTTEVQPEKRMTSAEIKKQIEEAQRAERTSKKKTDLAQSGLPMNAVADRINAISRTEPQASSVSKSEPAQAPAEPAAEKETASKESVDLKEWAKKKGINWETSDDVLRYFRKQDQEFHRKKAEEKKNVPAQQPYIPPTQNYPTYAPQAPAYNPPRNVIENLARQYNMTPEDFERFAQLNRDMTQAMLEQERQKHARELEDMKRENIKNSEFRELSADPVFRKQEVAIEFHNILEDMQEKDPESFSQDPYAYRKAYDRALQNYARRILESSDVQEVNGFQLPKTPPKPIGNGAGSGRMTNENSLSPAELSRLPVDQQRKYLDQMGLVMPKY